MNEEKDCITNGCLLLNGHKTDHCFDETTQLNICISELERLCRSQREALKELVECVVNDPDVRILCLDHIGKAQEVLEKSKRVLGI